MPETDWKKFIIGWNISATVLFNPSSNPNGIPAAKPIELPTMSRTSVSL